MRTDSIADALRRSRLTAGLTQRELAERAGVSRVTLARHETGTRSPTVQTLQAYARALGLSAADLLVTPRAADRATG